MKVFLKHEGEEKAIEIPFHVSEIPYSSFIDFQKAEQRWNEASSEEGEEVNETMIEELLTDCVAAIIKDDFSFLAFSLPEDNVKKDFQNNFQIKIGDQISTVRLYTHLVVLINSYTPEELPTTFSVEINKEKYYIEPEEAARLFTRKAYTTGEVIELKEFERNVNAEIQRTGDQNGNLAFTLELSKLAILLRKNKEKLPLQSGERNRFIQDRVQLFQHLDMQTILNIRFFLLATLKTSFQILLTSTFLKGSNPLSLETTKTVTPGLKP